MGTKAGKQNSGLSSHPSLEIVQIIFLDHLVIPMERDPAWTQIQEVSRTITHSFTEPLSQNH